MLNLAPSSRIKLFPNVTPLPVNTGTYPAVPEPPMPPMSLNVCAAVRFVNVAVPD